ncbi:MAG: hypothetical protein KBI30_00820 [Candidatus Atribacteria bacterium]|nr:hypothetical protein [Candidatus Atribacteria bacterium]
MENTILICKYPVKGEDYEHLGDISLKIREMLLEVLDVSNSLSEAGKKEIVRRVSICLYEAESNIIIHARFGIIKAIANNEKIKCIAKDIGPGIKNLLLSLKPGYSTASDKAKQLGFGAGMGLKNIYRISDFFIISSEFGKGTYLLFEVWKNANISKEVIKMKIKEMIDILKLELVTNADDKTLDKYIDNAYTCDLLSNVLSKAKEDNAWITLQTNVNVVGVAVIKKIPIIIITEGNTVPEETIKKAIENSIIIARTSSPSFEFSGKLYSLLNGK